MNFPHLALKVYHNEGILRLLTKSTRYLYNRLIWPYLPKTGNYSRKNGVKVPIEKRFFDTFVPWQVPSTDNPDHEKAYVKMIRKLVTKGQKVVIIGGGWGVSTIIAAEQVGKSGQIITYEAAEKMYKRTEKSTELNNVNNISTTIHAIVSDDVRLEGNGQQNDADVIPGNEIPDCDVLMVDCDGAEFEILADVEIRPELIILEHHAVDDGKYVIEYQPSEIKTRLESMGYEIVKQITDPIDSSHSQFGEEQTIFAARLN